MKSCSRHEWNVMVRGVWTFLIKSVGSFTRTCTSVSPGRVAGSNNYIFITFLDQLCRNHTVWIPSENLLRVRFYFQFFFNPTSCLSLQLHTEKWIAFLLRWLGWRPEVYIGHQTGDYIGLNFLFFVKFEPLTGLSAYIAVTRVPWRLDVFIWIC
jgi:hypothetical protein